MAHLAGVRERPEVMRGVVQVSRCVSGALGYTAEMYLTACVVCCVDVNMNRGLSFLGFTSLFHQNISSTRADLITPGSSVPSGEPGNKV